MNNMVERIAARIEEAREISVEAGQSKYRAYFVKTKLYLRYKDDVDSILTIDGYEDCIVTE